MVDQAEQLWKQARELAKAQVVGPHRLVATVAKEVKEEMASELGVKLRRKLRSAEGDAKKCESGGAEGSTEEGQEGGAGS